ncbi:ImuA family protein [Shewanella sp.]|uniref:ImuA family protein n=1 Tax=Shewanella sp. TaxID=50422 RepID=UPI003567C993
MKTSPQDISRLLGRQDIWLGQQTCQQTGYTTGFETLDDALPDNGWPRHGVCELSCPVQGSQLLLLLTPLLKRIQGENDEPVIVVGAPWQLNPQYLLQHGLRPEGFCLVDVDVRKDRLWAMEQSLASGGCRLLLGWLDRLSLTEARRLQLAAEKGRCLAIISVIEATEGNPLPLRLGLTPGGDGGRLELTLLKRRGGKPQDKLLIDGISPLLVRYLPPQSSLQVVQGPWGSA